MKRTTRLVLALFLWLPLPVTLLAAGDGVGELSLDRVAVATLIRYSTPGTIEVRVPVVGTVSARIGPPRRVELREGGIEAVLPFELTEPSLAVDLDVRFVPTIDREQGTVRLVAERVVPMGGSLPGLDLRSLVPAVELPRTLGGNVATPAGASVELTAFVHGVRISDERLLIEFGLVARPVTP